MTGGRLGRAVRPPDARRVRAGAAVRAVMAAIVVAAFGGVLRVGPATAEDPPSTSALAAMRYQVTFAARVCPAYAQLMANLARGDAIEAATAPGLDSGYRDAQPVDPDVESRYGGSCEPLAGWHFTLGTTHRRAGAISVVAGATLGVGPTVAEVPRLDPAGKPMPGESIAGAFTTVLTDEQVALAGQRQLWAQGGAPDNPLLAPAMPGLGFGVLRCGIDQRAGGNVSWIGFPAANQHLFCYVYYVRDAPAAGTVIVRAAVSRPVGYPQRFGFAGTLSFAAAKAFTLVTGGEAVAATFTRTGGTYQVAAQPPGGWRVAELACRATRSDGGPARSTVAVNSATGAADLLLAGGDVVTCSYLFAPPVEPEGLTVRLISDGVPGAVGVTVDTTADPLASATPLAAPSPVLPPSTLPFAGSPRPTPPVAAPSPPPPVVGPARLTAALTAERTAVVATGADLRGLPPGRYRVTVAPPDPGWTVSGATCGGTEVKFDALSIDIRLAADRPTGCVVRLGRAAGGIRLNVVTAGGTASGAFVVVGIEEAGGGWSAAATTTRYGVSAPARGDLPEHLSAGGYLVTPVAPRSTVDGVWRLSTFGCDPAGVAEGESTALRVTVAAQVVTCTAAYRFVLATRFQLTLRFEGEPAARAAAAVIEVSCLDGSTGRVVLGLDDLGEAALPELLSFVEPTRCTVTQPSAGAGPEASVQASAVLDPAPGNARLSIPGSVSIGRDVSQYILTVTNVFADARAPVEQAGVIRSSSMLPVILIGSGLFGLGAIMLLVMAARARRQRADQRG